jgi:hypothetical protein
MSLYNIIPGQVDLYLKLKIKFCLNNFKSKLIIKFELYKLS